ncbi:hypothetical protein T459_16749 [Capsicum annuum]|uniref:Uncharacterized protein n=1 Tax=Capsicum annuum TaxID=4072 RepID=A0A2G2Z9L6_CAPAN|nr:hypothetical protein T459_16749 [Capsicum annuum]
MPNLHADQHLSIAEFLPLQSKSIEDVKSTPLENSFVDKVATISLNTKIISRKEVVIVEGVPYVKWVEEEVDTMNIFKKLQQVVIGKMTTESQMMDATTSMGANNIATSSRTNAPPTMAPAEKPRKFSGIDFKRWQQKMFFYLTTLCLQRFTSEDAPEVPEGISDKDHFVIIEAWKHSDFLCRNYILSGLQDDLYNVYSGTKISKELWGALE